MAERLKCTPQVINNWRTRGIPAERVLEVEKATADHDDNGKPVVGSEPKVSRHALRPDLYPEEKVA